MDVWVGQGCLVGRWVGGERLLTDYTRDETSQLVMRSLALGRGCIEGDPLYYRCVLMEKQQFTRPHGWLKLLGAPQRDERCHWGHAQKLILVGRRRFRLVPQPTATFSFSSGRRRVDLGQ